MTPEIQASAAPLELLASDSRQPENRVAEHPVWRAALAGELPKARLKRLVLAFYPALAGRGRYAFAAKVSQLEPDDGKALFLQLYEALKRPEGDADAGWKRLLVALGASERELADALANPSAEAVDLVDVIRDHGLRSSPVAAAVIAHLLERHLPRLWGGLADSLREHYGVREEAVAYLRHEASRAQEVDRWVKHLVERYVAAAQPYEVFEGRRAAREALWAWTVLTESVQ
jgi:pyrroloquinoline quinone (PQQ) biosynthesis protein C